MKNIIREKEDKKIINYLEKDTSMRENKKSKYKMIFTFMYFTGCRINEVCKIKTEQIREILETKQTKILTTKTKRFKDGGLRVVPFSDVGRAEIKKAFADVLEQKEGYCIRAWNDSKREVNVISLANQINKYLREIFKCNDYTTHSFRGGIITEMMIEHGVDAQIVQTFIGHKDINTTRKYVRIYPEDTVKHLIR